MVAMESLLVAEEELRQQQEALRQSHDDAHADRERLLRLFHQAPDGYLGTDPNGMIQEANARFCNARSAGCSANPFRFWSTRPIDPASVGCCRVCGRPTPATSGLGH
jgi:hypothetical protein